MPPHFDLSNHSTVQMPPHNQISPRPSQANSSCSLTHVTRSIVYPPGCCYNCRHLCPSAPLSAPISDISRPFIPSFVSDQQTLISCLSIRIICRFCFSKHHLSAVQSGSLRNESCPESSQVPGNGWWLIITVPDFPLPPRDPFGDQRCNQNTASQASVGFNR